MVKDWTCPRCGHSLLLEPSWGGLVKRTPSACAACGAKLLYTTAGDVVVDERPTASEVSRLPVDED